jgi:hypothetical protein
MGPFQALRGGLRSIGSPGILRKSLLYRGFRYGNAPFRMLPCILAEDSQPPFSRCGFGACSSRMPASSAPTLLLFGNGIGDAERDAFALLKEMEEVA